MQGPLFSNPHGAGLKNAIELGLMEIIQKDPAAALSPEEAVARLPVASRQPDTHHILGKVHYPVAVRAACGDGTPAECKTTTTPWTTSSGFHRLGHPPRRKTPSDHERRRPRPWPRRSGLSRGGAA